MYNIGMVKFHVGSILCTLVDFTTVILGPIESQATHIFVSYILSLNFGYYKLI